jgi:hypothetical protein
MLEETEPMRGVKGNIVVKQNIPDNEISGIQVNSSNQPLNVTRIIEPSQKRVAQGQNKEIVYGGNALVIGELKVRQRHHQYLSCSHGDTRRAQNHEVSSRRHMRTVKPLIEMGPQHQTEIQEK